MTAAACAFWNDDAPVLCIFHARTQMTRVSGGASYADVIFLPSFAAFLLRAPLAMLLRPRCVYNKRRWRCAASKMVAKQRCSPNSLIHTHTRRGEGARKRWHKKSIQTVLPNLWFPDGGGGGIDQRESKKKTNNRAYTDTREKQY